MYCVITTLPTYEQARIIAQQCIEQKKASCVNIIPSIESFYMWEGKIIHDHEVILFCKVSMEKYDDLQDFISKNHPYEIPEIIAIKPDKVFEPYLAWVKNEPLKVHE